MPYYLYIHNIYLYQCHDTKPNSINIDWLLGLTPTITKYCTTIRENICYGIHHTRVPVGHYHLKHITIWFKKFKQHLQSPSKVILLLRCHKCKTNRICQIGWGHSNYFKQWHPIQVGVTSTYLTYSVSFAFMTSEKEDNFTWALQMLLKLLEPNSEMPKVVVTHRDEYDECRSKCSPR